MVYRASLLAVLFCLSTAASAQTTANAPLINGRTTLTAAIDVLNNQRLAVLEADYPALEAFAIDKNTSVRVRLNRLSAEEAAQAVQFAIGPRTTFIVPSHKTKMLRLTLTSRDVALTDKNRETQTFEVADLLRVLGNDEGETALTEYITQFVAPDTWIPNGGTVGTIDAQPGKFVVKHTQPTLNSIKLHLDLLRGKATAATLPDSQWAKTDPALTKKLDTRIKLAGSLTISDALTTIGDTLNISMAICEAEFAGADIDLRAKIEPFDGLARDALNKFFKKGEPHWTASGNVVYVAPPESLAYATRHTRVYNVMHIVAPKGRFNPDLEQKLVTGLTNAIHPKTWRHKGGWFGNARGMRGLLLVQSTDPILNEVDDYIKKQPAK